MIRAIVAIVLLAAPAQAARDVVSLNLCTDQLLTLLAPERIAALSPLARDPALSFVADAATKYPAVRPDAEAVLELHPALVLAGSWGAQTTLGLLEQRGIRVLRAGLPQDFDAIRAQIRTVAAALDDIPRGEALIAGMDARLAALPQRTSAARAVLWQARGWTSGPGSLGDAVLRAAGLTNAGSGAQIGLEALVAHPPDLLVVAEAAHMPSLATDMLTHPAVAAIPRRIIPPSLLICAGPFTAGAAEILSSPSPAGGRGPG